MYRITSIILIVALVLSGCSKDWLNAQPVIGTDPLTELPQFAGLVNNPINWSTPALMEIGSNNYFIPSTIAITASRLYFLSYSWAKDGWENNKTILDWGQTSKTILYANLCLEGLGNIERNPYNAFTWDEAKGHAHFLRGTSFFYLASLFAMPYIPNSDNTGLGVPLWLDPNPNIHVGRSSIADTYKRIILELETAAEVLPEIVHSNYKMKPGKQAVYGMLARVYLAMEDYEKAFYYSHKYLQISRVLLDFNDLITTPNTSMPSFQYNPEICYYSVMQNSLLAPERVSVDSLLFRSYEANDLRTTAYFRKSVGRDVWAGSYAGPTLLFSGIATDEMLLIHAECYARKNFITESMQDLNELLVKRYKRNTFKEFTASNKTEALTIILTERRKELLFRGLHWMDLRRLNRDPRFAVTVKRYFEGQEYVLVPNDFKYAFPIPDDEVLHSSIEQNPR